MLDPHSCCADFAPMPDLRTYRTLSFALIYILVLLAGCCHCALCDTVAAAAAPAPVNLLSNGDFGRGADHWTLQKDPPTSAKQQILDAQIAPSGVDSRVMHIDIAAIAEQ